MSNIETLFDMMADNYINKKNGTGAVVLGAFSEDEGEGFHGAEGDVATVVALVTTILKRTASKTGIPFMELLDTIKYIVEGDLD